jgi:hypothetical protein
MPELESDDKMAVGDVSLPAQARNSSATGSATPWSRAGIPDPDEHTR